MGQYRLSEATEKAIFDFIVSASGFSDAQIIWDKQSIVAPRKGVKPTLGYITLNISGGPALQGTPELGYKELDTYNRTFRRAFTVTVNVYSNLGWLSDAQKIADSIYLDSKRGILTAASVSVLDTGPVLDISELLDTKFEGRATVDLFMSDCVVREEIVGEVAKVGIAVKIGDVENPTLEESLIIP
jgi:hypothetical protein